MYKNDIKRGDSYRFGEYAMAPEYDNPFIKKEIEALLERMGAESIEDLMFTAEGDMGTNSALYLQPEGEQSSSVTRVFIKTGEEWRNVPPLDFPVLHTVGYYMYVPINTESYTGKISEVQLHEGSPAVIRNTDQCVVITKEAFDIITQEAQITIVGNMTPVYELLQATGADSVNDLVLYANGAYTTDDGWLIYLSVANKNKPNSELILLGRDNQRHDTLYIIEYAGNVEYRQFPSDIAGTFFYSEDDWVNSNSKPSGLNPALEITESNSIPFDIHGKIEEGDEGEIELPSPLSELLYGLNGFVSIEKGTGDWDESNND